MSVRKKLMQQGICNPEFYGHLAYKFKKIIGNPNFSYLLKRIVNRFKRAGYVSTDFVHLPILSILNKSGWRPQPKLSFRQKWLQFQPILFILDKNGK